MDTEPDADPRASHRPDRQEPRQAHHGYEKGERAEQPRPNTRNGSTTKTLKTTQGSVSIQVPRDRSSEFAPAILPKGQSLSEELEQRVLAMLGEGMTTRQIAAHLEQIYHAKLSASSISELAKSFDEMLKEWRCRPLESVYAIVIVDAIYIKIRGPRGVKSTAVYQVCAYDEVGRLEVLGVYLPDDGSTEEGARFWHSVFIDLKNRGLGDVLYLCMDGLSGLPKAAAAVWPSVRVQPCVVHLVRASMRHVPSRRRSEAARDMRAIYRAANWEGAELALAELSSKWGADHAMVVQWGEALPELSGLFEVGEDLRRKISTTRAIENLHSHQRRYLKAHKSFPHYASALRHVTLVARKLSEKNISSSSERDQWRSVVNDLLFASASK